MYLGHVVVTCSTQISAFTFMPPSLQNRGGDVRAWWGLSYLLDVADTADLNNMRAGEDLCEPLMWKKETVMSGNIICMQIAAWMERINTDYLVEGSWQRYYIFLPHWTHQSFSQKNRHQRSPTFSLSILCSLEHADINYYLEWFE